MKINKKIDKIKSRIEKNQQLMQSKVKELPKEDLKLGKSIVDRMLNS